MIHISASALSALGPLAASKTTNGSSTVSTLLPIILLIAVGYFIIIRPQRNRQRKLAETRRQLEPGVEVLTTFGMYATVVAVEDSAVVLEVAPGVQSRFSPQVVGRVLTPVSEPDPVDAPVDAAEPAAEPAAASTSAASTPAVEG